MFLAEPPNSPWDLHFRLFGIPVRIHPWFWLAGLFLTASSLQHATSLQQILLLLLPWMAALLIGILVHELGHALAMRMFGQSPRITLYGFGGLTSAGYDRLYTSRGFSAAGQVLISAAGPVAGFLLAGVVVLLSILAGSAILFKLGGAYGLSIGVGRMNSVALWLFVHDLLFISVYWGLVNLLPIYPLDGGQIAREVLLKLLPRDGIRLSLLLSIVAASGMALVGLLLWQDMFVAVFFGFLAYSSFMTLQAYLARP